MLPIETGFQFSLGDGVESSSYIHHVEDLALEELLQESSFG
ncbi:MAG: hypothetical protein RIQ41_319 [Candidatus Parcubacteria bacterium]